MVLHHKVTEDENSILLKWLNLNYVTGTCTKCCFFPLLCTVHIHMQIHWYYRHHYYMATSICSAISQHHNTDWCVCVAQSLGLSHIRHTRLKKHDSDKDKLHSIYYYYYYNFIRSLVRNMPPELLASRCVSWFNEHCAMNIWRQKNVRANTSPPFYVEMNLNAWLAGTLKEKNCMKKPDGRTVWLFFLTAFIFPFRGYRLSLKNVRNSNNVCLHISDFRASATIHEIRCHQLLSHWVGSHFPLFVSISFQFGFYFRKCHIHFENNFSFRLQLRHTSDVSYCHGCRSECGTRSGITTNTYLFN